MSLLSTFNSFSTRGYGFGVNASLGPPPPTPGTTLGQLFTVGYGNGIYTIAGYFGSASTSVYVKTTNLTDFTELTLPGIYVNAGRRSQFLEYDGTNYIIVGKKTSSFDAGTGFIYYSNDTVNWLTADSSYFATPEGFKYINGFYYLASNVDTSDCWRGTTLDNIGSTSISSGNRFRGPSLAYNGTTYVLGNSALGIVRSSSDGITFTSRITGTPAISGIIYNPGFNKFIAAYNTSYVTSTDGISWTTTVNFPSGPTGVANRGLVSNSNTAIAYGTSNLNRCLYRTTDGVTFTLINLGFTGTLNLEDAVWTGTEFVIVGTNNISGVNYAVIIKSSDGITWTRVL